MYMYVILSTSVKWSRRWNYVWLSEKWQRPR